MRCPRLYLLIAVLCAGCTAHRADMVRTLKYAKNVMQEHPDSALAALNTINDNHIKRRADKAAYALLYSQALDKNYIDLTDDSLISVAYEYYRDHGNVRERFLSLYYLGRIQCNARKYVKAMLSFTDAEGLLEPLDDDYLAGMLYTAISGIYLNCYDHPSCLKAARKAYEHFSRTPYVAHQNYALLDIGLAYSNMEQFDKSSEILDEVLRRSIKYADTILHSSCLSNLALQYVQTDDFQKAKQAILKKSISLGQPLDARDLSCLAYVYATEGREDSTEYLISEALRLSNSKIDSAGVYYRQFQSLQHWKKYEEALSKLEISTNVEDSIVRQTLQQSVVSAQRDYFQNRFDFVSYKLKTKKHLWAIEIAFLIFIIIGTVIYLHIRIQRKNLEITRYMNMVYETQNTLQNHNTEMSRLVQKLFKDKFELIDRLGCTYYERQNTPSEQQAIYNDVMKAIHNLRSNKQTKTELEHIVNVCNDNIMQKIRNQLPRLKVTDYDLLCYIYAGLSYRAISIFTQDKIENIYNRKSRLKSRILNSDAEGKEHFLKMLS